MLGRSGVLNAFSNSIFNLGWIYWDMTPCLNIFPFLSHSKKGLWGSRESLCQLTKTRLGMESDKLKPFYRAFKTMGTGQIDRTDEEAGRKRKLEKI